MPLAIIKITNRINIKGIEANVPHIKNRPRLRCSGQTSIITVAITNIIGIIQKALAEEKTSPKKIVITLTAKATVKYRHLTLMQ